MNFLLYSRRLGYLSDHGWSTDAEQAARLGSHVEAREAARAAARKYGVAVSVLASPAKSTWRTRRDQQTAVTAANRSRVDRLIQSLEAYGTLVLSEPHGRIYGY
jgi:hypothetical protein